MKNRCRFVQKATALAISRDGSSGGMVRSLIITKDKASSREIQRISWFNTNVKLNYDQL